MGVRKPNLNVKMLSNDLKSNMKVRVYMTVYKNVVITML